MRRQFAAQKDTYTMRVFGSFVLFGAMLMAWGCGDGSSSTPPTGAGASTGSTGTGMGGDGTGGTGGMGTGGMGTGGIGTGGMGTGGIGTGGIGTGGMNAGNALPCDVDDVVTAKCQLCHTSPPKFGAPMPLVTADDFAAPAKSNPAKKVSDLVKVRIHDPVSPMPPPPNGPLDSMSMATMDAWLAMGAPAGDGNCGGSSSSSSSSGSSSGGPVLPCTPDISLKAATPYAMPQNQVDQYMCFGADVQVGTKRHITHIIPQIDNDVILHHILLFETTTSYGSTPKPCGGAPGRLVSVWAPGGGIMEFPPQAGLPLEGTAHYVLQMHYSNLNNLSGQKDQSGFDLCTTATLRPNDADIMAFGTAQINIPAHGTSDRTCDVTMPPGLPTLNVFAAMPHMHKLGKIISGHANPGGNQVQLTNRNPWSFDSQYWDSVSTTLKTGDKVRTRCAWQNPTNQSVGFGENTSDEMCFVFAAYYPRITTPGFNWGAFAAASQCTNTP